MGEGERELNCVGQDFFRLVKLCRRATTTIEKGHQRRVSLPFATVTLCLSTCLNLCLYFVYLRAGWGVEHPTEFRHSCLFHHALLCIRILGVSFFHSFLLFIRVFSYSFFLNFVFFDLRLICFSFCRSFSMRIDLEKGHRLAPDRSSAPVYVGNVDLMESKHDGTASSCWFTITTTTTAAASFYWSKDMKRCRSFAFADSRHPSVQSVIQSKRSESFDGHHYMPRCSW